MADKEASSGKAWTDNDRMRFLFQIYEQTKPAFKWSDIELPEGRSRIACERMLSSLKTKLAKEKEGGEGAVADAEAKTPKKRGPKKGAKGKDGQDEAEDGVETPKTKTPGKKRGRKSEDEGIEGEADVKKFKGEPDGTEEV
ncbi:hypothetical protein LTS18_003663 [Coniosporium uncinatum]|uniref:Uncharacterized protein n=1 Tax=Coniosporium uncinatum TaxID=93489 RepID=A0ACC3D6W0_9PEZI|nr:hypothetical protein LTS18_003663 [Coniosporium uncinatum]